MRESGMRGERALLRLGESLVRRACRHLPGPTRDDRYREWAAELPAILHDPEIRLASICSSETSKPGDANCRTLSHGPRPYSSTIDRKCEDAAPCSTTTPFGAPEEPEV